ncbi:MAG TPA: 2-amino-4-hydroxy-6-hydroxymethyldihydropteridine diphosphokinase [Kofleriaceae bacterium]|nr:2-amino-4-hydroxy-6-hydroxymethyldihydropteridine diphosphokinase [Kofleriaceae bacterium]
MREPVVIGLGGNVGTDEQIIERFDRARAALGAAHGALGGVRSAPLYRSAPVGPPQPAFLNTAVVVALDDAQPGELIALILEIERQLGRTRALEVRWGPRPIDLDVLVWGARRVDTPELSVPHPRLAERRFALAPLVALLGEEFVVPGLGPVGGLLGRVAGQACEEIAAAW